MSENVEVRIREASSAMAVRLCAVPLAEIDGILPMLVGWGVLGSGDVLYELSGQFVVTEQGAYFEVIVGDEEAP